jgi:plasmid maintenance system antidote protein VapI
MARASKSPISDLLRRTIVESGRPHLTIEQETGVQRGSIARFVAGKRSLRLDFADRLAAYFGLALTKRKKG